MPVHPYDEKAIVERNRDMEKDKFINTQIYIGMHVGTHIDAPAHLIEGGKGIESYSLLRFIGDGCVIDASGLKIIGLKEEYKDKIRNSDIVLIYTGYGRYFEETEYYKEDAPIFSEEFAEYLVKEQIRMVGMDLSSPDRYPYEIHKILLNNDVLIIENLNNLQELLDIERFTFCAMPISIDAEASITRAISIVD